MDGMSLQSTCVRSAPATSPSSFMRKPSTLTTFMASASSQIRVRIVVNLDLDLAGLRMLEEW